MLDKFGKEIKAESVLLIPIVGSIYIGKAIELEASLEGLFAVNYICDKFNDRGLELKETYSYPERCIVIDAVNVPADYTKLL